MRYVLLQMTEHTPEVRPFLRGNNLYTDLCPRLPDLNRLYMYSQGWRFLWNLSRCGISYQYWRAYYHQPRQILFRQ